jgi:hypothetical protein
MQWENRDISLRILNLPKILIPQLWPGFDEILHQLVALFIVDDFEFDAAAPALPATAASKKPSGAPPKP